MKFSSESGVVFEYIQKYAPVRPVEIVTGLGLSKKNTYKHLSKLLKSRRIQKVSNKGKVFYSIYKDFPIVSDSLNREDLIIEKKYIYVSPSGEIIRGINGFSEWTQKNGLSFEKEKQLYVKRLKELNKVKKNQLLSGKGKVLSGNDDLDIDELFFSDFYTFDHFGKTMLGQLVYVAKGSQNIDLIYEIVSYIRPAISFIIEKYNIQNICFIPPTIDRKIQIMDILEDALSLKLDKIRIEKVSNKTKIAQKTLKKLEDRIINASSTISVRPNQKINGNVLIIDDATGSGATLNETSKKIRIIADKKIKIIGYSIVGSYKGFDVISEV